MISLLIGTMFSGKSTELLKNLRLACIARKKVCLLRPNIDTRAYVTHDDGSLPNGLDSFSIPVSASEFPCLEPFLQYDTIGIDEWQFFPTQCWETHIYPFLACVQNLDKDCYIAGLSGTFYLAPFEIISRTIPLVNYIKLNYAVCAHCGRRAYHTYRYESQLHTIDAEKQFTEHIGAEDKYAALCWHCWHKIHQKN